MFGWLSNSDRLPALPEPLSRTDMVKWGQDLINRSEGFANRNRLGAVYVKPGVMFLTSMTGAAGVATQIKEGNVGEWAGWAIVGLSAIASAATALLTWSGPEKLYAEDRVLQVWLWNELAAFNAEDGIYAGDEIAACKAFAKKVRERVLAQVEEWAKQKGAAKFEAPHQGGGGNAGEHKPAHS